MGMVSGVRDWWRGVRAKVRTALEKLPPIDVIWAERRVAAAALKQLGDRVSAWEPDDVAALEYVAMAARIAQFSSGGKLKGAEKRALVIERVRKAWAQVGRLDDQFDLWWNGLAGPWLDAYADGAKAADAWVPPQ